MRISEPSSGGRRRRHRSAFVAAVALTTLTAVTAIVYAVWPAGRVTSPRAQGDPSRERTAIDRPVAVEAATVAHPVYRHSVIPGGVHNRDELLTAIGRDDVVADHYRSLSVDRVRVERLPDERRAYVSYRIGDKVYWTKNKVTLPAGEQILTDGTTEIRARCGNCISTSPQLPTSDDEPDAVEFDALSPPDPLITAALVRSVSPGGSPAQANAMSAAATSIGQPAGSPFTNAPGLVGGSPNSVPATGGGASSPVANPIPGVHVPRIPGPGGPVPGGFGPGDFIPGGLVPGGLVPGGLDPGVIIPGELIPGELPPGGLSPGMPGGLSPGSFIPGTGGPHAMPVGTVPGREDLLANDPVRPVPVPQPSTILLLGTGAAGIVWRRLRSRGSH